MSWANKVAWDKIEYYAPRGENTQGGGYYVRTCIMESLKQYMGDFNPFPDREWRQAMLVKIPAGNSLIIHNDGVFKHSPYDRFHIPVTTNDQCKCFLHVDGTDPEEFEAFHCEVGKIYHMDPTFLHYSENKGTTDRIHICIDLKVPHELSPNH